MTELQMYVTFVVFAGVILTIAFNVIDLTLATLLGVSLLIVTGVLTRDDVLKTQEMAGGTIALLFGGMVVAPLCAVLPNATTVMVLALIVLRRSQNHTHPGGCPMRVLRTRLPASSPRSHPGSAS